MIVREGCPNLDPGALDTYVGCEATARESRGPLMQRNTDVEYDRSHRC